MKKLVLTLFAAALCAPIMSAQPARAQAQAVNAFVNVTIVPMDSERTLAGQTVIVQDGRISAIGPVAQIAVPAGAQEIDGAGKFLIPGLAEMHGHNPPPGSSEETIARTYFLYVANGVTLVRSMLGWDGQQELREKVRRGELLGPTLYLAGPSFNGGSVKTAAEAERKVREQKKQGWDLLKVHPGVPRDAFDAMARTAHEVGIHFAGHVPADVGLSHAIASGQRTIDHLDGYVEQLGAGAAPVAPDKLGEVVRHTRAYGAGVVPTMVLWDTILGAHEAKALLAFDELKYVPAADVAAWKANYERTVGAPDFKAAQARQLAAHRRTILKALNDGGVDILFGTDSPQIFSVPGFSIHREMQAMRAAGLSNFDILASATRNVASHLGEAGRFGTIVPGARADLVLLNANPLDDLGNVARRSGVMVRGLWLSEREIAARLDAIATSLRK
ncbi:MAG: amidohydrolase family protein [Rhodospirillaceae bacterium]